MKIGSKCYGLYVMFGLITFFLLYKEIGISSTKDIYGLIFFMTASLYCILIFIGNIIYVDADKITVYNMYRFWNSTLHIYIGDIDNVTIIEGYKKERIYIELKTKTAIKRQFSESKSKAVPEFVEYLESIGILAKYYKE